MGFTRQLPFDYRLFNLPVTCRSVVFADLLDNLIRAGGSQAGDDTHGQGGQGISGHLLDSVACLTAVAAKSPIDIK